MENSTLVFIKLGGSLITDKDHESTLLPIVLERISTEIQKAMAQRPGLKLLIGHGSGSFGHVPAKKYHTRQGIAPGADQDKYWRGFSMVYQQAHQLHNHVMDELHKAGIPGISFPPDVSIIAQDRKITHWPLEPMRAALAAGMVPVVFGDVIFDQVVGGTILSTEELFSHLARHLKPDRILISGIEDGVWLDYPQRTQLAKVVSKETLPSILPALRGSGSVDVTGGMESKVLEMLALTDSLPGLEIQIVNGAQAGNVYSTLMGANLGTIIR